MTTTLSLSYCQRCVWATHPGMLTGYCLRSSRCDRCGRVTDLAMVRVASVRPGGERMLEGDAR